MAELAHSWHTQMPRKRRVKALAEIVIALHGLKEFWDGVLDKFPFPATLPPFPPTSISPTPEEQQSCDNVARQQHDALVIQNPWYRPFRTPAEGRQPSVQQSLAKELQRRLDEHQQNLEFYCREHDSQLASRLPYSEAIAQRGAGIPATFAHWVEIALREYEGIATLDEYFDLRIQVDLPSFLREAIAIHKHTQEEAAGVIGVPFSTCKAWLRGANVPGPENRVKLLAYLKEALAKSRSGSVPLLI